MPPGLCGRYTIRSFSLSIFSMGRMIKMFQHIMALLLLAGPAVAQGEVAAPDDYFVVRPKGISEALQNPLKGFRSEKRDGSHPYATLSRVYIPWNEIENDASDGIEKIKAYCDRTWRDVDDGIRLNSFGTIDEIEQCLKRAHIHLRQLPPITSAIDQL